MSGIMFDRFAFTLNWGYNTFLIWMIALAMFLRQDYDMAAITALLGMNCILTLKRTKE